MRVTTAKNAGFCPGVKRATGFIEALLESQTQSKIYTLGTLIHNPVYTQYLEKRGVRSVSLDRMKEILDAEKEHDHTLIIRTHGIPREEEALRRNLEDLYPHFHVEDMTCPYVKRIHKIAAEETASDTVFCRRVPFRMF